MAAAAQVTLVIPWLAVDDQEMVFPNNQSFETPEAQEQFVRAWARKRTGMPCNFKARVLLLLVLPAAPLTVSSISGFGAVNTWGGVACSGADVGIDFTRLPA